MKTRRIETDDDVATMLESPRAMVFLEATWSVHAISAGHRFGRVVELLDEFYRDLGVQCFVVSDEATTLKRRFAPREVADSTCGAGTVLWLQRGHGCVAFCVSPPAERELLMRTLRLWDAPVAQSVDAEPDSSV